MIINHKTFLKQYLAIVYGLFKQHFRHWKKKKIRMIRLQEKRLLEQHHVVRAYI